jgi:hypothetical protein
VAKQTQRKTSSAERINNVGRPNVVKGFGNPGDGFTDIF